VIKSGPKKTDFTPSIRNNSLARGLQKAALAFGKSKVVPVDKTFKESMRTLSSSGWVKDKK
jgi:hypothetical protein